MVESRYPKGTPMECYKKILRVIVSIHPSNDPNVIDTQFNVVNILIDRFDKLYSDTIEISKIRGFLKVSKDLRYKQIMKEIRG
mgnify:FL=1